MHVDRLSSVLWLCAHAVATCVILVCYSSWVWPRHQLGYAESHDAARLEPSSTSPGRVIGSASGASNTFFQHGSRHQIYAYKILTPPVAQKRLRGFSRARGEPATHSPRLSTTFGAYLCIGSISLAVVVELDVAHPGRGRKRGGPDLRRRMFRTSVSEIKRIRRFSGKMVETRENAMEPTPGRYIRLRKRFGSGCARGGNAPVRWRRVWREGVVGARPTCAARGGRSHTFASERGCHAYGRAGRARSLPGCRAERHALRSVHGLL